jgi:putative addiction module component (TIGR02574 family)
MRTAIDSIFEAAMALPLDQRALLSDRLLGSLPSAESKPNEALWSELDRRWEEHLANPADAIPWEAVKAEALAWSK